MILELLKIVQFLQIYADINKKSKSVKKFIYISLKDLICSFRK